MVSKTRHGFAFERYDRQRRHGPTEKDCAGRKVRACYAYRVMHAVLKELIT